MFDKAEITVRAGAGGTGVVSFRREKFTPFGGPDGGDGGSGGDVIILAEPSVDSLRKLSRRRFYRAAAGGGGKGKRRHGKNGERLVLTVPVGTVVSYKLQTGGSAFMADLEQPCQQIVAAKGGKGGLGNTHFTSSTNQAPEVAQKGAPGEEKTVILEMRLIADVGIIGYPNAGKSTLLAAASGAKPDIANYPFTTREPVLGVVEVKWNSFVLAEVPGLIDGAHVGRGMGHEFLRHVLRTKVLIHLVDGCSTSPLENMMRVNTELGLFDATLVQKPQLLAVNKIDIPRVQERLAEIEETFSNIGNTPFFVSAVTGEGVTGLMEGAFGLLQSFVAKEKHRESVPVKVFRPRPSSGGFSIQKEGDVFVVVAPSLERLIVRVDSGSTGLHWQLRRQLTKVGITKALEKAGIKPGDKVRCGDLEWNW